MYEETLLALQWKQPHPQSRETSKSKRERCVKKDERERERTPTRKKSGKEVEKNKKTDVFCAQEAPVLKELAGGDKNPKKNSLYKNDKSMVFACYMTNTITRWVTDWDISPADW